MKKVSIIIPMFNESQHIQRTINSASAAAKFANLNYEVIVIDNGSSDNSRALAAESGAVVNIQPDLNIGGLRNTGADLADGDYIVFLDADIEVPNNWLTSCVTQLQNNFDVIAHDCDTPAQAPWFARAWQKRNMSKTGRDRVLDWLATPNLFLTRQQFDLSGGFNTFLSSGEDKEFGLRLHKHGAKQISIAQPSALHWGYEQYWSEWVRKEFWRQSSHLQLLIKKPSLRLLRFPALCIATTLFTLAFILSSLNGYLLPALCTLLLGLTVPLVLSIRQSNLGADWFYTLQLFFLHWLRLHIGCAAVLHSALKIKKQV